MQKSRTSSRCCTNSKIKIQNYLVFTRSFLLGDCLKRIAQETGLSYRSTCVDWASYYRDIFIEVVSEELKVVKLSGLIEIDESLFGRRFKHHRGAKKGNQVWIFGMMEAHAKGKMLLFPVVNKTWDTLSRIICRFVEPGSTIYSDGWASYCRLPEVGYTHYVVCHKTSFRKEYRNQATGEIVVCITNKIEGAWKHAKDHFRVMNGTSPGNFEGHLCQILYRNWALGTNPFKTFAYI